MSNFLDYLNVNYKNLSSKEFKESLIDEEYIEDNALKTCYYCENHSFDIFKSAIDVYEYLKNLINKYSSDVHKNEKNIYEFGLLCNWFHSRGIPVFAKAKEHPNLSVLVCNHCGKIVGVKLNEGLDWEYPYLN